MLAEAWGASGVEDPDPWQASSPSRKVSAKAPGRKVRLEARGGGTGGSFAMFNNYKLKIYFVIMQRPKSQCGIPDELPV
jgi:hypothetical protein